MSKHAPSASFHRDAEGWKTGRRKEKIFRISVSGRGGSRGGRLGTGKQEGQVDSGNPKLNTQFCDRNAARVTARETEFPE